MGQELVGAILEIAQDAFVSMDASGRVTEWNVRAEELFGYPRGQALGRELAELIVPERSRAAHRAGLQRALEAAQTEIASGERYTTPVLHVEAVALGGYEFPVQVTITALPAEVGGVSFHGWIHDVSERAELLTELQAQLRSGAPGFAEILDSLDEAVTIRDPHHHIIYANRAAQLSMGFSSLEELQRRPPGAIFAEYEVSDEHGGEIRMEDIPSVRLLEGKPAEPLVMRTTNRATGEVGWRLLKASGLHDADGDLVAAVTVIEDITQEKVAELRGRFLSQATETLMSSLDYEQTLQNVAALAVPELADWCAVDLVDELGRRRQVAIAHQDPSKLELAARLRSYEPDTPNPEAGLGKVLRTGRPELLSDISEEMLAAGARDQEHLQLLQALDLRSALIVPLRARGRTLGAITLVTAGTARRLQANDLDFAQALANRAAVAVDNARLATARRNTAITLQRTLLPEVVPPIGGWEVATMYRPATGVEEVEVGGDFYDFVQTDEGWLVLLGDVAGKGAEAAVMTSLMRHGIRFLRREETHPSQILQRLNEALHEQPEMWLVTAVCALLDHDRVVISVAGHPPPLVVRSDGRVRTLAVRGPVLGAWTDVRHVEREVTIAGDETLVLYTDGVVDTRSERERFGTQRLRAALRDHAGSRPEELLTELDRSLQRFQRAAQADDTAAVAMRPVAA